MVLCWMREIPGPGKILMTSQTLFVLVEIQSSDIKVLERKFTVWRTSSIKVRTLYQGSQTLDLFLQRKQIWNILNVETRGNFNEQGNQSFMYPSRGTLVQSLYHIVRSWKWSYITLKKCLFFLEHWNNSSSNSWSFSDLLMPL